MRDLENLTECINGDKNPIHPPSKVLCEKCFNELDRKMNQLLEGPGANRSHKLDNPYKKY